MRAGSVAIGRQRELHAFEQALSTAAAGRSQTLVIAGDAGAGKTTLLRTAAERAVASGGHVCDIVAKLNVSNRVEAAAPGHGMRRAG